MRVSLTHTTARAESWAMRAGATGFAFFLLKGLLWLVTPALFAFFGR